MNYATLIRETVEELAQLEARQRPTIHRDRVRFIRLLKTGLTSSRRVKSSTWPFDKVNDFGKPIVGGRRRVYHNRRKSLVWIENRLSS